MNYILENILYGFGFKKISQTITGMWGILFDVLLFSIFCSVNTKEKLVGSNINVTESPIESIKAYEKVYFS